jgi:ribosomal-protein-serine acetyltransferase
VFGIAIDADSSLQLLEEHHAEELFALVDRNRSYLREWLPWLDGNTSVEESRAFIRGALKQLAARNGFACGIWHRQDLAGVIGLHHIDWANRQTSVGYWVGAPYQGMGLITKAFTVLLEYLFEELRLNRVEVACAVDNRRSRAIPERLGFQREGVLRQREWLYDRFVDHVVYGMLAAEWAELKRGARSSA